MKPDTRTAKLLPADLPPVLVGGTPLVHSQVERLLVALEARHEGETPPLVAALRERADPATLDRFAAALVEQWQRHGCGPREGGIIQAAGQFGGDEYARQLGALARNWKEKRQHGPVGLALQCLFELGSEAALMQLRAFTRVPRDWALKGTATAYLLEAAARRGLSLDDLDDRMTPTFGLDAEGSATFDFGSRRFHLVLSPSLRPTVRDDAGNERTDLPEPNSSDDAVLAAQAAAHWRVLKKQIADALKQQSMRLEEAMLTQRSWRIADFETYLLGHPLMRPLLRGLIWGGISPGGTLAGTFRVAEDGTLAGPDDREWALPEGGRVLLLHPLHLTADLRHRWGELLADYEQRPPFPQLGRALHRPEPDEVAERALTRRTGVPCMAAALAAALERRGWVRAEAGRRGIYRAHRRAFIGRRGLLTAVIEYAPGIPVRDLRGAPTQCIACAYFLPRLLDGYPPGAGEALPLGDVDPIAFSEVAALVEALTAHQ